MDITKIKMLLGIVDTDIACDKLLEYLVSVVTSDAKKYCRTTAVTEDLQLIINDMVVDRFRARGYGQQEAPQTVTSITEGNVTVQLKTQQYNATMELTDAEKKRLIPYRRLFP